jgi:hypothetical protein
MNRYDSIMIVVMVGVIGSVLLSFTYLSSTSADVKKGIQCVVNESMCKR